MLNFDGVSGNRDRELDDPRGYGLVEYACSLMAREAGIDMSECRLLSENGKQEHFTREDLRSCARVATLKRGRADQILDEVQSVAVRWPEFAEHVGVPELWREHIGQHLRLTLAS